LSFLKKSSQKVGQNLSFLRKSSQKVGQNLSLLIKSSPCPCFGVTKNNDILLFILV
jgi:hypothetical protein